MKEIVKYNLVKITLLNQIARHQIWLNLNGI